MTLRMARVPAEMFPAAVEQQVLVGPVDVEQGLDEVAAVDADAALLVQRAEHDTDAHAYLPAAPRRRQTFTAVTEILYAYFSAIPSGSRL